MVGDNKFQRLYWMFQRLYWVRAIIEASLAPAKAELRAEAKADQKDAAATLSAVSYPIKVHALP